MRKQTKDDKTLANINDLVPWAKNPKVSESKDLERLKRQILELGVYKPLVCTEDGTLLGGNQRFKVLRELYKECPDMWEWVWVSVVEAWTDTERFKYAISDNDVIGKYTREKVMEVIPELGGQDSLFEDYRLNFGINKTLDNIKNEIDLTEEQLKVKTLEDNLRVAGLNEETIDAAVKMSNYHKNINKLSNVDLEGKLENERFPITFWCTSMVDLNYIQTVFGTGKKYEYNVEKLIELTKKYEREVNELPNM